jgi:hypothetical protein
MFNPIKCGCSVLASILVVVLLCGGLSYFLFSDSGKSLRDSLIQKLITGGKPVDLGISYAEKDITETREMLGVEYKTVDDPNIPIEESMKVEGAKQIETSIDSTQLTALINGNVYKYMPVSGVQARINSDGSLEMSGIIIANNLLPYLKAVGLSNQTIDDAINEYLTTNIPFYFKGTGDVINNQVSINLSSAKVGPVAIPSNLISSNTGLAEQTIEDVLKGFPSYNVESMTFENGELKYKGTIPESESYAVE